MLTRTTFNTFLATLFAVLPFLYAPSTLADDDNDVPPQLNWAGNYIALTGLFSPNGSGIPQSARTEFRDDWDDTWDGLMIAEHELFHAIGFTVNGYPLFASHVSPATAPPGDRVYTTALGMPLMTLTPGPTTHADPNVPGQELDIMRPTFTTSDHFRLSAFDAAVLFDAFGYSPNHPIAINVIVDGGSLSAVDMVLINAAVQAAESLFEDPNDIGPNAYQFTWTVAEVPEPNSLMLIIIGIPVCLVGRRWHLTS